VTALSGGDYSSAAVDNALGSFYAFDLPIQEVLLGAAVSF
jgi:hypothetical protein